MKSWEESGKLPVDEMIAVPAQYFLFPDIVRAERTHLRFAGEQISTGYILYLGLTGGAETKGRRTLQGSLAWA